MNDLLGILQHMFLAYLVVGEPALGHLQYRRLQERLRNDPRARERVYGQTLIWEWGWMVVIALLLFTTPHPWKVLGLVSANAHGWAILGGVSLGTVLSMILMRRIPKGRKAGQKAFDQAAALLPVTPRERWVYAAVAVSAGICEEILFRGYLMFYLGRYLPGVYPVLIAGLAAVVFGLGHAYQGWKGVLQTGLLGWGLGIIYWVSGSLIPGMVFHALVDLRVLAIWEGKSETTPAS